MAALPETLTPRAEVWRRASQILSEELHSLLSAEPRKAAEMAFVRGGPSVSELEERIRGRQLRAASGRRSA